ncbi:MAG TPA: hypothetical protein VG841_03540 [Caulobacterales bacterium]|nr:hypothetical protein [Caulobacterales bacterium]
MAFDATDLSSQEQFVVERTRDGEIADFTSMAGPDGQKPTIRAAVLRKLLLELEAGWTMRPSGLRIRGARIEDVLDLCDCAALPGLDLTECWFAEPLLLLRAGFARLSLRGAVFSRVDLRGARIEGAFDFSAVRSAEGGPCAIDAYGVRVGGDVSGFGARLAAADGVDYALILTNAEIGGSLDLARDQGSGEPFRAVGGVNIANARIARELWMSNAVLEAVSADALRARGLEVGAAATLRDAKMQGPVTLSGAAIGRNLDLRNAEIISPHRKNGTAHASEYAVAIDGVSMRVGGAALLQGANVKGELFLTDARIDGFLAFGGGRFMNSGGWAIRATNARVGGNLTLKLAEDDAAPHGKKTVIQGGAKFDRAQIEGAVSWLHLELRGPGPQKGPLLSFADARIEGSLEARHLTAQEDAQIDLSGARCASLDDDLKTGWGVEKAMLDLEGFAYGRLDGGGKDDRWKPRLAWLKRSRRKGFSPQPYAVLAQVYARAGRREDARRVLLEQHDLRTRHGSAGPLTFVLSSTFGLTAGYGFAPIRAARALVIFLALGIAGVFAMDATGVLVTPQGAACRGAVEPALYAIDVALPVIDLGQESRCAPGRLPGSHLFAGVEVKGADWRLFEAVATWRWAQAIYALLGALLTALAVITFSGMLKPKSED